MFHSNVLGDPGSGWEKEGAWNQGVMTSTSPPHPKGAPLPYLSGSGIHPLTAPPRIDGETEALRGEGLAEVLALCSLPFAQQHPSPHQLPQGLHPLPRIFNAIGLDEVIVFV